MSGFVWESLDFLLYLSLIINSASFLSQEYANWNTKLYGHFTNKNEIQNVWKLWGVLFLSLSGQKDKWAGEEEKQRSLSI